MSEENKSDEVENGFGSGEQQSECCCSSDSSCCCGDTSEENGCCDPDASQDDPNTGKKKTVKIEYLYLDQTVCDRCQGTDTRVEKAIEELAPIMDMAGYKLKMKRVEISTKKLAKKHKFLSSPTVRVNGVDICPTVIENDCDCCRTLSTYDVNCRQFEFNGKLYEVPPTALVVKRTLEIVFGHEKPAKGDYKLPKNLKGFFDGKKDKKASKATSGNGHEDEGSSCCCGGSNCC